MNSVPVVRYTGRLDYDITPSNRLSIFGTDVDNPYYDDINAFSNCPLYCQAWDNEMESGQVADVWYISASTINEAKISFSYFPEIANDTSLGHNYPAAIGWKFAKANDLPSIYLSDYATIFLSAAVQLGLQPDAPRLIGCRNDGSWKTYPALWRGPHNVS